jgi:hypothetical protein
MSSLSGQSMMHTAQYRGLDTLRKWPVCHKQTNLEKHRGVCPRASVCRCTTQRKLGEGLYFLLGAPCLEPPSPSPVKGSRPGTPPLQEIELPRRRIGPLTDAVDESGGAVRLGPAVTSYGVTGPVKATELRWTLARASRAERGSRHHFRTGPIGASEVQGSPLSLDASRLAQWAL